MNKDIYQTLLSEWLDKTNWVQETAQDSELGLHRADVILNRFRELETQRDQLLEALKSLVKSTAPICDGSYGNEMDNDFLRARAAIAKAEENT